MTNTAKRYFLFLVNPISGGKDKRKYILKIEELAKQNNLYYQIETTPADGNYDAIKKIINENNITDVVILGGDGTVSLAVANLRFLDINFGIIPLGSGNGLAFAAGIKKNITKAFKIILHGKPQLSDALQVNDNFSCMMCGLGFDGLIAKKFTALKNRGLWGYTKLVIKNFIVNKSYAVNYKIDDTVIDAKVFVMSICNINQYGNHITIAPRASLTDGKLDVVLANKSNIIKLVFCLTKQLFVGKPEATLQTTFRTVNYFQANNIEIENIEAAPVHIDGEYFGEPKKISIKIIPACYKLLVPYND